MPKRPARSRKPRPTAPARPAARVVSVPAPGARPAAGVWAERLLWALVLLPPLLVLPAAREAFRLPKLLVSEWLALASLLLLAAGLAWRLRRDPGAAGAAPLRLLRHPAVLALLPVLLVASAGWLTTGHPLHLRQALADLWIGAACLAGWSLGLAAARLARLLLGLLLPAAALAAVAVLQAHGLWQPFDFEAVAGATRLGVTATAGNPGDLGAYLVLPALLAQWQLARQLARKGAGWRLWALAAALVLILYALARTQTLAALAALALASVVLWAGLVPRRRLPLLAAGLAAALLLPLLFAPLRTRVVQKASQALAGDWNQVLTGRLDGWRAAAHMLAEHPLAGVGQGAYRPEFVPAKLQLLERGTPFLSAPLQVVFANAHNEVLEAGAEWGIPGLLALLWAVGVLLAAARRAARPPAFGPDPAEPGNDWSERSDRSERAGPMIAAGLTALAVLSLAHFPFHIALTAFPALLFLAWVLRRAEEASAPAREPEQRAAAGRPLAGALAWSAVAVLALALALQTVRLRDRLQASALLRRVETRTLAAASTGRIASTLLQQNLLDLDRAARLDPSEVGVPLARGSQFLLMRRAGPAIESYERALALEPRPEIYLNRGRARLLAGETAAAEQDFVRAARLDPALQVPNPFSPQFGAGAPRQGPL